MTPEVILNQRSRCPYGKQPFWIWSNYTAPGFLEGSVGFYTVVVIMKDQQTYRGAMEVVMIQDRIRGI